MATNDSPVDLVILGAGSGGYACALRAAELGKSVVMVERDKVGGTCLHRGCIPTKALLHAGAIADDARESASFGVKVTFEGIDRSGKTTQAAMLCEALGAAALGVREPGGTPTGERVREILKDPAMDVSPQAEALLFAAARAELVSGVIRPALAQGRVVVSDRFLDSSLAYQGAARGLGVEQV